MNISTLTKPRWQDAVIDALKKRGVRTLAYFHTDHFEPWRPIAGRAAGMETCIDDVLTYLAQTRELDFARRASLFYKANVNYLVSDDRELIRADPDDSLGFVPRSPRDLSIGGAIVKPIVASAHEIHVHIHHEYYTYNDTARDDSTYAYLQTPRGRSFDNARLELAVRLSLDTLRDDGDLDLDRWFFIHGHWALNASDPHECTIVREIEILRRNGCLGDFTQPAGRLHVDSRIDTPYLVDPVAVAKGYDSRAANPIEAAGAGDDARRRFFIWASATTHRTCSIDTFSPLVQKRLAAPGAAALDHVRGGVVVDGVLYVKTHCHSMHPAYFAPDGPVVPHLHDGVRAELGGLFDAANRAGADVRFLSASEAYQGIVDAAAPVKRDLASDFNLDGEPPMAALGLTVEFRRSSGDRAPPPPLREPLATIPLPSRIRDVDPEASRPALDVIAHIAPLGERDTAGEDSSNGLGRPEMDAGAVVDRLMEAADVQTINDRAGAVCLARLEDLGGENSGLTGFYPPRARQRELLQPSEALCAEFVRRRLARAEAVYEIGCGLGLLSLLLAMRGVAAVGIERNSARLASGQAIAEAYVTAGPLGAKLPRLVNGVFPRVARRERNLSRSVALVTNLLGTASQTQQEAFIDGLAAFGAVLIDVQRFYERRTSTAQIAALLKMFAGAGFATPRLAFELGQDGRFLLFTHPAPRQVLGWSAAMSRLGLRRREPLFEPA